MNRVRKQTQAQIEAAGLNMDLLQAQLGAHLPSRNTEYIARLSALVATAAMIESDSLVLHVIDSAALALQAETSIQNSRYSET